MAWEKDFDNYMKSYGQAEKTAFEAMIKASPVRAYNAIFGHGKNAYNFVRNITLPEELKISGRVQDLVNHQVGLWKYVPDALYRSYSRQMIVTTLGRVAFNKLPGPARSMAHPVMQTQLARLFTYKQEIAHYRQQAHERTPYEALMHEFNPEYSEAKMDRDLAVLQDMSLRIRDKALHEKPVAYPDFRADLSKKEKRKFLKDMARSMGVPLEKMMLYDSAAPAALGSPQFVQVANNFKYSNFVQFAEDGMHEFFHANHKLNLPDREKKTPFCPPLSTGQDEGLAYLGENKIFETAEYTEFLAKKMCNEFKADPSVWNQENIQAYHRAYRFSTNRLDCCDIGNWIHFGNLIAIERDIINGREKPENYYARWKTATEASIGHPIASNNFDYTKNFQPFAGLIGNFPGYIEGAFLSAQLFEALESQVPEMRDALAKGDLHPVADWLNRNIHSKGSELPIDALYEQVTGSARQTQSFERLVSVKYGLSA